MKCWNGDNLERNEKNKSSCQREDVAFERENKRTASVGGSGPSSGPQGLLPPFFFFLFFFLLKKTNATLEFSSGLGNVERAVSHQLIGILSSNLILC